MLVRNREIIYAYIRRLAGAAKRIREEERAKAAATTLKQSEDLESLNAQAYEDGFTAGQGTLYCTERIRREPKSTGSRSGIDGKAYAPAVDVMVSGGGTLPQAEVLALRGKIW
jgi:hypothetical protein